MPLKPTKITFSEKFLRKLNTTWGALITGLSLVAIGFGFGVWVNDTFHKIESNEINQKHNEQLYMQKIQYERIMQEITHQKYLLEIENGKLRKN
jgi:hypothetical protein